MNKHRRLRSCSEKQIFADIYIQQRLIHNKTIQNNFNVLHFGPVLVNVNSKMCFVICQQDNSMCSLQNYQVNKCHEQVITYTYFDVCACVCLCVYQLSAVVNRLQSFIFYLTQKVINCMLIMHHYHLFNNLVACSKINTLHLVNQILICPSVTLDCLWIQLKCLQYLIFKSNQHMNDAC